MSHCKYTLKIYQELMELEKQIYKVEDTKLQGMLIHHFDEVLSEVDQLLDERDCQADV